MHNRHGLQPIGVINILLKRNVHFGAFNDHYAPALGITDTIIG